MIHVDRSLVPKPTVLNTFAARQERAEAHDWFQNDNRDRQQRFDFKIYRLPEVSNALNALFNGKCAYCETRLVDTSPVDVELYRPKGGVAEAPEHPGYWWLASDWDNMLTTCANCNRVRAHAGERAGKGNRFPLRDENRRALHPGQEVEEDPLLLDPCRDDPAEHLVFEPTGNVVSATDRGQASISVLTLGRPDLVAARRKAASETLLLISNLDGLLNDLEGKSTSSEAPRALASMRRPLIDGLLQRTDAAAEFAGMNRQLARPSLERIIRMGLLTEPPPPWLAITPRVTKASKAEAKRAFSEYQTAQSSFSLDTEAGKATYRSARRLIQRIAIHNVKAIPHIELDLTAAGSGRTPWLMLLGENGTGKSTILQAVALTLVGAEGFQRLARMAGLDPRDFIRFRCKSGRIAVQLSEFKGPHQLVFEEDRVVFSGPTGESATIRFNHDGETSLTGIGWEPQMLLLGYGATRLLPRSSSALVTSTGDTYSRVDNLFDPFVPLRDADEWMANLGPVEFDSASLVLKDLLSLAPGARFEIDDGRVVVVDHRETVPLRQLSDGYQSVVATAIDILEVMTRVWPNLADAEGIVLLDEIGAHLHPTWKMQIVRSIRRAAPGVQFLTSTHDPLCLRGLGAGEVVVMERDENHRVRALTDFPSPDALRVDQLLTSEFFGLNSTLDPDVELRFDRYYELLGRPHHSAKEAKEMAAIKAELDAAKQMGGTLRERLMYDAIDKLVARSQRTRQPVVELKPEAVELVAKAWAEAPLSRS